MAPPCWALPGRSVRDVMKDMWLAPSMKRWYLSPGWLRSKGVLCQAGLAMGPRRSCPYRAEKFDRRSVRSNRIGRALAAKDKERLSPEDRQNFWRNGPEDQ